jgi:phytoene dehydrogenase-like protein
MPHESIMYDTIIIGAGMSGLAAGIRLAHFGKRVCIVEQHGVVGGLNSYYRRRGRDFDVGLHALTNFVPPGSHRGPLVQLLRQLRLGRDELDLVPQLGSAIVFPGVTLRFSNDFALFESEVQSHFPEQADNIRRLAAALLDYDRLGKAAGHPTAHEFLGNLIGDPLLVEMICCPVFYYGGARPADMDFDIFSILFRSIFLEGLARPVAGVRAILNRLVERYEQLGGELRLRAPVSRIVVNDSMVEGVVLQDGRELAARHVLSSAGWPETLRLCGQAEPAGQKTERMSFVEVISVLDTHPKKLGHDYTMVFFNDSEKFHYEKPLEAVDVRSGLICCPNNFACDTIGGGLSQFRAPSGTAAQPWSAWSDENGTVPLISEGMIRLSAQANFDRWTEMDEETYRMEKLFWQDRMAASAVRFMPDFRGAVVDTDMFTPLTIRRFTGHDYGAIYGSPQKRHDGTTHLKNLFLCGNDQGLIGIVGTIISGITVTNRYLLKEG